MNIQTFIFLAGVAQITLALGSISIPRILNWQPELKKVHPLIAKIFWVYAAYILVMNLSLGLLSVFACNELADGSKLALFITGFISVYWISRLMIQFFFFDRAHFPVGKWHTVGETVLVSVFVFLSVVYAYTFYYNYIHP